MFVCYQTYKKSVYGDKKYGQKMTSFDSFIVNKRVDIGPINFTVAQTTDIVYLYK